MFFVLLEEFLNALPFSLVMFDAALDTRIFTDCHGYNTVAFTEFFHYRIVSFPHVFNGRATFNIKYKFPVLMADFILCIFYLKDFL